MRVVVCIRQGLDGEINPFDAAAYECALRISGAEVTLLSMGVPKTADLLCSLTRLGAKDAVLLTDKAFAGADTLATAYALSCAVKKLSPDLVVCGRQTLVGDTAQTGPMLAELLGYSLVTNVMAVQADDKKLVASTRDGECESVPYPALITVERSFELRFPRLGSKQKTVEAWSAADVEADISRCGLVGSPTRVIKTFENKSGRRRCKFIEPSELEWAISEGIQRSSADRCNLDGASENKLSCVVIVGDAPREYAETVCDNIVTVEMLESQVMWAIEKFRPAAVLFASDSKSKRIAASVAAKLSLGLCADCTSLEALDDEMIMYRPALSGSLIAKIKSLTRPALATVRTEDSGVADIIVGAGFGVKDSLECVRAFAERLGADMAVSRKLVDNGYALYEQQVGLTGKTVSPPVYVAIGISGAVHHIAGIERSGTVIAINPDRNAPIFDYADFGIVAEAESLI